MACAADGWWGQIQGEVKDGRFREEGLPMYEICAGACDVGRNDPLAMGPKGPGTMLVLYVKESPSHRIHHRVSGVSPTQVKEQPTPPRGASQPDK
jgi:hypothetical protein